MYWTIERVVDAMRQAGLRLNYEEELIILAVLRTVQITGGLATIEYEEFIRKYNMKAVEKAQ